MEIPKNAFFAKVEWRNGFFELCDGEKREKLDSAAKHERMGRCFAALDTIDQYEFKTELANVVAIGL